MRSDDIFHDRFTYRSGIFVQFESEYEYFGPLESQVELTELKQTGKPAKKQPYLIMNTTTEGKFTDHSIEMITLRDNAQCWNQEKSLSEIQNRVPKCVEHGKIAENVGKVVFFSEKNKKIGKFENQVDFPCV